MCTLQCAQADSNGTFEHAHDGHKHAHSLGCGAVGGGQFVATLFASGKGLFTTRFTRSTAVGKIGADYRNREPCHPKPILSPFQDQSRTIPRTSPCHLPYHLVLASYQPFSAAHRDREPRHPKPTEDHPRTIPRTSPSRKTAVNY
eukprot:1139142-Pelagomonas_calceolata.AAC.2